MSNAMFYTLLVCTVEIVSIAATVVYYTKQRAADKIYPAALLIFAGVSLITLGYGACMSISDYAIRDAEFINANLQLAIPNLILTTVLVVAGYVIDRRQHRVERGQRQY